MKFWKDVDGTIPCENVQVDGYLFADRLLEGVIFVINCDSERAYLKDVNDIHYINSCGIDLDEVKKRAVEYAKGGDLLTDVKDGEEVWNDIYR